ncbi:MAG: hypothetical protein DCC56_07550 [Anaerolineae bacterium]|nr:MAG: hypothetical protein DCC56_07550 [Anaerolineae bacterium]WKZ45558.1 MAG: hypothetical protein QY302_07180 [Anaerolineales bacterium]
MYILKPDEKTTPVMLYTQDALVSGEAVTRQSISRVSIWLRSDGAPKYIHVLKPHVVVFGRETAPISLTYSEIYFPTPQLIAFHTMPPTHEPLDYDPTEANRMMQQVNVLVGTFMMKGKIRVSTQTEVVQSLEVAGSAWMSLYDVEVANLYVSQMPVLQTPMVLLNPARVAFAVE